MAGTLVQDKNIVQKVFIASFKAFDLNVNPVFVNSVMGYEKKWAIMKLLESVTDIQSSKKLITDIYKIFNQNMIEYYLAHAKPVASANTILKKLKSHKLKIGVNTGFGKDIMNTIISSLNWDDLIDARISSDQVAKGRPHPHMIEYLKMKTKISSNHEVAKIGDTPSDLLEGNQAQCALNIGIFSKNFPLEELKKYPHTHIVPNLNTAVSIILNNNVTL